jgi:hypothetical protein
VLPGSEDKDPKNYLGRFEVMSIKPEPCAEGAAAELFTSQTKVDQIHKQTLSWKAAYNPEHEGLTKAESPHGLGYVFESAAERLLHTISLSTDGFEPPAEFRTSDHRQGQALCNAYEPRNQGGCGSCYAFAAASAYSARMCHATNGKFNIVASPQEMMDCSRGCNGGNVWAVFSQVLFLNLLPSARCPYVSDSFG